MESTSEIISNMEPWFSSLVAISFRVAKLFEQFLVEGIKGYDWNTFEFGPEIKMSFKDFLILALGATSLVELNSVQFW